MKNDIGIVGIGVMGANLALNMERHGFTVVVLDHSQSKIDAFLAGPARGKHVSGAPSIQEFVAALAPPRRILVMVPAGAPVDSVLESLRPCLESGDIVVDGGNSHFRDTERRQATLLPLGIRFTGMGVSGGEEGALLGPSLMPGGDREAYARLQPILERIAAVTDSGPCVSYIGARGAGHFVKMVHNGIEYGDMQLIAESYDLLRYGLGLSTSELAGVYGDWNEGELRSYLIEITARIVDFPDDLGAGAVLLDRIRDEAAQKGTGKWTSEAALDLGVPIPTLAAAVDARLLSARREVRARGTKLYATPIRPRRGERRIVVNEVRATLYAAKICAYAQGFELLQEASREFGYALQLGELARIWKGGCIIRAAFLDDIRRAFGREPDLPNLLLDPEFARLVTDRVEAWRRTVTWAAEIGLTPPAMSASLAYFDSLRRERLPANLIQAQRDLFGAHTYQRTDREGAFHTDWQAAKPPS